MASVQPQTGPTSSPKCIYRFGRFELETRSGELRRNGFRVRMQEQPRRILVLLLEHAGDLVTREELHRILWPADTFVDFDIGLNAAIRKLRIALGDRVKHAQFIETVSRRGYRFAAPVAMFEVDPSQPPSQLFPAGLWLAAIQTTQRQAPSLNPDR
jgi:DNA-binding winged helix-turn-helix (wHTH) protein